MTAGCVQLVWVSVTPDGGDGLSVAVTLMGRVTPMGDETDKGLDSENDIESARDIAGMVTQSATVVTRRVLW